MTVTSEEQLLQEALKQASDIQLLIDNLQELVTQLQTGKVPYLGATGNLDLGLHQVKALTAIIGGADNNTEVEETGFIKHNGTAGGYDDVQFNITPKETGAGHPTLNTWNTDFKEFSYAVGDYANAQSQEAPHWWKHGEHWSFHLHWSTGTGNYVAGDKVQFEIRISAADSNEQPPYAQFPAATVLVIEHTFDGTVPPFSSIRSRFPNFDIPASMTKIGAQVKVKLSRIAKSAGGTNPGSDPFCLQVGAHTLSDTRTSRTNGSK